MATLIHHNETEDGSIKEREVAKIWKLLEDVFDPEVPVLSVIDLGIVREVTFNYLSASESWQANIIITPTYSGCPAMDAINMDIRFKLLEHGFKNIKVSSVLSPAWTTDWMSASGKEKLKAFGIAPPNATKNICDTRLFAEGESIQCPLCNSFDTKLISRFGSTACKALYQCQHCKEPFDYFKCH